MNPVAAYTHALLSYSPAMRDVADAAEVAPHDARLQACAAAHALSAMTREGRDEAATFLARAQAAHADAPTRRFIAAIAAWARGDLPAAIQHHRAGLLADPHDRLSAKLCQLHHLSLGDFAGMRATVALALAAAPDDHFLLGQHAFALEETGEPARAEAVARRAIALAAEAGEDDPWAVHALAHVHYSRGEHAAAVALVEVSADLWARSSSFMRSHAWWHAALSHLDRDDTAAALRLYDAELEPHCAGCVQALVNAVALLARLHLRGVDVATRLAPLADLLAHRTADRVNGFLDLHYLYGLALAHRGEARALLAGLTDGIARTAGVALLAHAEGRMREAATGLAEVAPVLPFLGGSHEQRDLWQLVELDAAARGGATLHASSLLARRLADHPEVGWQRRLHASLALAA